MIITKTLKEIKQKFGKRLSSVVLFGSLAKDNPSFNDMLVIVRGLPRCWRKRDAIAIEIEKTALKTGRAIHIQLLSEEEFKFSINNGAPLLLEISLANKIIYDNGFFKKQMNIFKEKMLEWEARKINGFWEIPKLAIKSEL